jgi:AraC-like DNA-binding protein
MPFEQARRSLQKYPYFRAGSAKELRHSLTTLYGASDVDIDRTNGLEAWGNFVQMTDIALGIIGTDTAFSFEFPEVDYVRQLFAITGRGSTTSDGIESEVNERFSCTTSQGRPIQGEWDAGHERLTLRVNMAAMDRKLTMLLGARPKAPIEFEPQTNVSLPYVQSLVRLMLFAGEQADVTSDQPPPLVLPELEQAVIVNFLAANRHAYSQRLEQQVGGAAPRHVQLAEEYIEANWSRPITIETLVEVTGVSARALFRSFKERRGYTPMAFAKITRLRRARDMLASGNPDTSVTAVAYACGFATMGHFAKEYRQTFGELPSRTIARSR